MFWICSGSNVFGVILFTMFSFVSTILCWSHWTTLLSVSCWRYEFSSLVFLPHIIQFELCSITSWWWQIMIDRNGNGIMTNINAFCNLKLDQICERDSPMPHMFRISSVSNMFGITLFGWQLWDIAPRRQSWSISVAIQFFPSHHSFTLKTWTLGAKNKTHDLHVTLPGMTLWRPYDREVVDGVDEV